MPQAGAATAYLKNEHEQAPNTCQSIPTFFAEILEVETILYGISRCIELYKPAIGEEASQLKNVGKRHVLAQGCPVCCEPVIEERTRDH